MYGAIPLSYKGMTTKMHLIPITTQTQAMKALLFTRLFTVRGVDEQMYTGGSLSSSWGSNTSTSSAAAVLNAGFPFPKMTPIKTTQSADRLTSASTMPTSTPSVEQSTSSQRVQTPVDKFSSGWFPSPSPIIIRGPPQPRQTPTKSPSPDQARRRVRGTTMFAIGVIIPVSSEVEVNTLVRGDSYTTLRRAIEELVRDVHEKLEIGAYKVDFSEDVDRFLTRVRDGLGVLKKVPAPWKGTEDVWRDLILSLTTELDSNFLTTLMSNLIIELSDRFNTPPGTPTHPSSPSLPPPPRLLLLSSSAPVANRLTTMLLPLYKIVYPPHRRPKRVLPKPPKLQILPSPPRANSVASSYVNRPSIPREYAKTGVEVTRRGTYPTIYQRREPKKSPPTLSLSQTPTGGNPSSVSSWFGSWIKRGGPLALASSSSPGFVESSSPFSARRGESPIEHRDSDSDTTAPIETEVIKDANGEVVDVKSVPLFHCSRRQSGGTIPDEIDIKRRGSMTLNNVTYTEDTFRVTGYHSGRYHADFHLQSMERTEDLEADVFRVLKEDILYFFTPPVHATPLVQIAPPETHRDLQHQREVTCIIADMDTLELTRLTVCLEEDEEQQERTTLTSKDDRPWRRIQDWAIRKSTPTPTPTPGGIDNLITEVLA